MRKPKVVIPDLKSKLSDRIRICFVSLFSLTSLKNIYLLQLQEENVIVLKRSFPCHWRLHAAIIFHACVYEAKISICNRCELEEFKTTCKLVFNCFGKP